MRCVNVAPLNFSLERCIYVHGSHLCGARYPKCTTKIHIFGEQPNFLATFFMLAPADHDKKEQKKFGIIPFCKLRVCKMTQKRLPRLGAKTLLINTNSLKLYTINQSIYAIS